MVSNHVISLSQNTFRDHDYEGLQALLKPVPHVRIMPGALTVDAGQRLFFTAGNQPWLALVGAVVGDGLVSDGPAWLAIVTRAAASSREAMSTTYVGNESHGGSALSPLTYVPNGISALLTSNVTLPVNAGLCRWQISD